MSRARYLGGKVLRYSVIIVIILTLNFLLPRMMPGDPVMNKLGEIPLADDPELVEALKVKYGLDKGLWDQYLIYLGDIVNLDFGYSIQKGIAVSDLLGESMIWTMMLVLPSIVIGSAIGLVLGVLSGMRAGSRSDRLMTYCAIWLYTIPSFLMAMMFLTVFSFHLGWFPLGRLSSDGSEGIARVIDVAYHLVLPVIVLSIGIACSRFIVVRNSVIHVKREHFVTVARSKGLTEGTISSRHVMRNIMPQFISMLALSFGFMLSGALMVEIVFSLRGMGTLIYDAVSTGDYPVLQGAFLVLTIFVLTANLIAEILYGLLDPRIGDDRCECATA